jgi:hypothetical protein
MSFFNEQLDLVEELRGTTCRCGNHKAHVQTFCRECYYSLPKRLRAALYHLIGDGYEEAYDAATTFLEGDHGRRSDQVEA